MKKLITLVTLVTSLASFAQAMDVPFSPQDPEGAPSPMSKLTQRDGSELVVGPGCWLRADTCINLANYQEQLKADNIMLQEQLTSTVSEASSSSKVRTVVLVVAGIIAASAGVAIGYKLGQSAGPGR